MKRCLDAVSVSMVTALLSLAITFAGATASSPPSLSSELLGVSAMPAGWSVAHPSGSADLGCFHSLMNRPGVRPTTYAKVGFENSGTQQVFVEALATYVNARDAYQSIIAAMSGCKRVDGFTAGKATTVVAKRTSFATEGDASAAFARRLVIEGITMRADMLVIRKGGVIMGIEEGGLATIDGHQFERFIAKALQRLSTR